MAIVLVPSVVNGTVAGWKDTEKGAGEFTAGSVEAVQNLKCINQGVGGLLTSSVRLEWAPPASQPPVAHIYRITVKKNGSVDTVNTTSQLNYLYTDSRLVKISSYELTVQQVTTTGEWAGPARTATATGISVVLGLTMVCGSGN
ncbi:hypothetical protein [Brevibacterium oceani]|uniref:hypothetical protein n=1 Tax=Brevibacterium oceani TaxID=358099 RepID=UPI001B3415C1|nr:hypothetical protein [Brevibacterium oceani]